jgi:NTE family protein
VISLGDTVDHTRLAVEYTEALMTQTTRLALVLGGGGIAGIAWQTGFLLGVQDEQPATARFLLDADLLLGTSAGSTVAAQVSSGVALEELFARQLAPNAHEIEPRVALEDLMELFEDVVANTGLSSVERLREVGRHAVAAETVAEDARRAVIAARLPSHAWPHRRLVVTAIDVESGELVLVDKNSGVSLVDAVAASCAVPGVWPPVTIATRRFMDGGVGSTVNVAAVTGADAVILLAPMREPGVFGRTLADELAEFSGPTLGLFADDASIAAFGANVLSPACRPPSATAGREQGRRHADDVAAFVETLV